MSPARADSNWPLNDFPLACVQLDSRGTIRAANAAALQLLGVRLPRTPGRRLSGFVERAHHADLKDYLSGALDNPAREPLEVRMRVQRRVRHVQIVAARAAGAPAGINVVLVDVTPWHLLMAAVGERDRRQLRQLLHDGAQQSVNACELFLSELFEDLVQLQSPLAAKAARIRQLLRKAGAELRRLSRGQS